MEKTKNLGLLKPDRSDFFSVDHQNDNLDKIDEEIGNKVDKVVGKGLSSNDFTDEEKGKLAGISPDTYAEKSIYGDTTVSMGRKSGSRVGIGSFAFGQNVEASGEYSFAAGRDNDGPVVASGTGSLAEGGSTTASGMESHAEGRYAKATGNVSHAEGNYSLASGFSSHAEGYDAEASGDYSHASGYSTKSSNFGAFALGKFSKTMKNGGDSGTQIGDLFVIGNGIDDSKRSNALRITYIGEVMGTKAFQSSGADYAEFIKPWADGNPDNEDRIGYFVTVKDGLLYKANEGDYIAGITSGNPSVVGNADEDYYWRYERDEFNRIVMEDAPETVHLTERKPLTQEAQREDESGNPVFDKDGKPEFESVPILDEDGNQAYEEIPVYDENGAPVMVETGKIIKNAHMKLADDYDPSLQDGYVGRKDRKEWDYVGMVGVLPVRDDGTCIPGKFCRCGVGGVATLAERRDFDVYMVIERITESIVSVILK